MKVAAHAIGFFRNMACVVSSIAQTGVITSLHHASMR